MSEEFRAFRKGTLPLALKMISLLLLGVAEHDSSSAPVAFRAVRGFSFSHLTERGSQLGAAVHAPGQQPLRKRTLAHQRKAPGGHS
jgi:hypothetical protein